MVETRRRHRRSRAGSGPAPRRPGGTVTGTGSACHWQCGLSGPPVTIRLRPVPGPLSHWHRRTARAPGPHWQQPRLRVSTVPVPVTVTDGGPGAGAGGPPGPLAAGFRAGRGLGLPVPCTTTRRTRTQTSPGLVTRTRIITGLASDLLSYSLARGRAATPGPIMIGI